MRTLTSFLCIMALGTALAVRAADETPTTPPAPAPAATEPSSAGKPDAAQPKTVPAQPTPEEVIERLNRPSTNVQPLNPPAAGVAAPDTNPQLVGTAPGLQPVLETEGRWMLSKPGHMVSAPEVSELQWMFVFDDPLLPAMVLLPCRLLEDMEAHMTQSGPAGPPRMTLSGQVSAYRGRNYLMPTLMKLTPDRGNLNP